MIGPARVTHLGSMMSSCPSWLTKIYTRQHVNLPKRWGNRKNRRLAPGGTWLFVQAVQAGNPPADDQSCAVSRQLSCCCCSGVRRPHSGSLSLEMRSEFCTAIFRAKRHNADLVNSPKSKTKPGLHPEKVILSVCKQARVCCFWTAATQHQQYCPAALPITG